MTLAEKIKVLMKSKGINQIDLALEVDIPTSTISRIIRGETLSPRSDVITKLANYFGTTSEYLMGFEEKNLSGTKMALYDKVETLNEEELNEVVSFISYIKSKRNAND